MSDNWNANVTGCNIIGSEEKMYMCFGKLSCSIRQIQNIVDVMKICVFIDSIIREDNAS